MRKDRSYFEGKHCCICRRKASIYRMVGDRFDYLCDKDKCEILYRQRKNATNGIDIGGNNDNS